MPPDRRSIRSRCSDGQSRKGALQFFVDPPYDSFPGPGELRHLLVLLERDRRDGLIFGSASRNLSLDSVSYIDEELPHAVERGSRLLWIVRDRPMPRHEVISVERSHRIEHSNPRDTVPARHARKFVVEEHLAHVDDSVLGHEQDAVALRVRGAEVEDLDLLAAKIERHAIAKRSVRQPCAPLLV